MHTDRLVRWFRPEAQFLGGDLLEPSENAMLPSFSLAVINPPFGRRITDHTLLSHYELAERGPGQKLRTREASVLYLERAYHLLQPGGWLIALLPDGVLSNVGFRPVREWLEERFRLRAVVSLPHNAFVSVGTGIKASVVCLQKWGNASLDDYPIFMADLEGDDNGTIPTTELTELNSAYRMFCEEIDAYSDATQV